MGVSAVIGVVLGGTSITRGEARLFGNVSTSNLTPSHAQRRRSSSRPHGVEKSETVRKARSIREIVSE